MILLGVVSLAVYFQVLFLGDLRQRIPEFLLCYFALSALYLCATVSLARFTTKKSLYLVLAFACSFRLVLFFSHPWLSDDVYRYQWEGYLQVRGVNPFEFAPQALELASFRNEAWQQVNNKDASAIYPPLLQLIHAAVFWTLRSLWGFKLAFLVAEAGLVWLLLRLLRFYGRQENQVMFYVWNPLPIIEIAGNGHHDACVAALVLAAAWFTLAVQHRKAVLSLAGAILCKLYPVAVLPFFLKRLPWRSLLWLGVLLPAAYLPYASAGDRLFSGLLHYGDKWRFNGFLFQKLSEQVTDETAGRLLLLMAGAVIGARLVLKVDLLSQLFWTTGIVLLCAPTLFPWYLIWITPFLCFFPNPAWLLLTVLSPLSYNVLIEWWTIGVWRQSDLFLKLQYYPFYALLIWSFFRAAKPKSEVRCRSNCRQLETGSESQESLGSRS